MGSLRFSVCIAHHDGDQMGNVEGDELAAADALVQQELLAVLQVR